MSYTSGKTVKMPFDAAVAKVREELKKEGMGILNEIDFKAKLKEKLGVDFRPYTVLGACIPRLAFEALEAEPLIGVMLPCNVIVQQSAPGEIRIDAVDPLTVMQAIRNPALIDVAREVKARLERVVQNC